VFEKPRFGGVFHFCWLFAREVFLLIIPRKRGLLAAAWLTIRDLLCSVASADGSLSRRMKDAGFPLSRE
jgi:hypothetical protein